MMKQSTLGNHQSLRRVPTMAIKEGQKMAVSIRGTEDWELTIVSEILTTFWG